jgi:hypothetical protein
MAQISMRSRHLDQVALGQPTTLTSTQYAQLLAYIQALRNVPQASPNPPTTPIVWPTPPSFIPASMTTLPTLPTSLTLPKP